MTESTLRALETICLAFNCLVIGLFYQQATIACSQVFVPIDSIETMSFTSFKSVRQNSSNLFMQLFLQLTFIEKVS